MDVTAEFLNSDGKHMAIKIIEGKKETVWTIRSYCQGSGKILDFNNSDDVKRSDACGIKAAEQAGYTFVGKRSEVLKLA